MEKTTKGVVRYIDDYTDAPNSAEFIVRQLSDGSVVLEHYFEGDSEELKNFPFDSYWKDNFSKTLSECRRIVDCPKIMWVEKPLWYYD